MNINYEILTIKHALFKYGEMWRNKFYHAKKKKEMKTK